MSNQMSLTQTRSNLPATNTPRMNVVSAVAFLTPLILGGLLRWFIFNPAALIVGLFLGLLLAQAPKCVPQPGVVTTSSTAAWSTPLTYIESAPR